MSKNTNKLATLAQLVEKKKQAEKDKLTIYTWEDKLHDVTFQFQKVDEDEVFDLQEKISGNFDENGKQISNISTDEMAEMFKPIIFKYLVIDGKHLNDAEVQDFLLGDKKLTIKPSEIANAVVDAIMISKLQITSLGGYMLSKSMNMKEFDKKVEKAKN